MRKLVECLERESRGTGCGGLERGTREVVHDTGEGRNSTGCHGGPEDGTKNSEDLDVNGKNHTVVP